MKDRVSTDNNKRVTVKMLTICFKISSGTINIGQKKKLSAPEQAKYFFPIDAGQVNFVAKLF